MKWIEKKDQLKILKTKIADIEDSIDNAKADLVVTHGLLDQNDKLRQKIQEEERAKAKREIEKEMSEAKQRLDIERTEVRSTVIAEVEQEVRQLKDEIAESTSKLASAEEEKRQAVEKSVEAQEYADILEGRLADAEALYEKSMRTIELHLEEKEKAKALVRHLEGVEREKTELMASFEKERAQLLGQLDEARKEGGLASEKSFEEQKYSMFKTLMDGFNAERKQMEGKFSELQALLSQATKDIIYLQQQNDDLNNTLNEMAFWEPEIAPSKPVTNIQATSK
jgi:chromosome segregation ATPase